MLTIKESADEEKIVITNIQRINFLMNIFNHRLFFLPSLISIVLEIIKVCYYSIVVKIIFIV